MLQNYLKIALRNLLKNKSFSAINIFGLTVGLASCLLIGLYIANELSFDRYHANADRIWRVNRKFYNKDGSMQLHLGHLAPPFGPLLKSDFPDIEEVARMLQYQGTFRHGDQLYIEPNMFVVEPSALKIFDIPLVEGNPETALNEPFTIILDETTAKKYFKNDNPINQTLHFGGTYELKVTGVFKDFPYNSHFHPNMLASFATLRDSTIYGEEGLRTNWGNNSFSTFILLPKNYPAKELESKLPDFLDRRMSGDMPPDAPKPSSFTSLHLDRLTDIHLHSHLDSEIETNGDIKRVYIFSIIALFVLLIACVNYMNLSTARSAMRAKEIGVRKVVGAQQRELIGQFLSESVLLSVVATVLAMGVARLALPFVNRVLGQELSVGIAEFYGLAAAVAVLAVLTGVLAGIYPAFFLSGLKPLKILKGNVSDNGSSGVSLRKVLVVGQFAISVALIIATMVVFHQLKFMQDKSLGLNKDQVVTMSFYTTLASRFESFRSELLSNPAITNVARSSRIPSGRLLDSFGSANVQLETDSLEPNQVNLKFVNADHRFVPLYELGIAAGRNLRDEHSNDLNNAFLINEAAAKRIGWKSAEEAVGKRMRYGQQDGRIVGVLKDFNFESLHQGIQPMIFFNTPDSTNFNYMSVKLAAGQTQEGLAHLESIWVKFLPEFPYQYQFLDEQYDQRYESEQRQGNVFIGFALLAILVACLGLFGLSSFVVQQRVKEIGIRKVLGATTPGIVGLLSKDFLTLVVVSLVIAVPVAWHLMDKWLEDFAYRVQIGWWIFAVAGIVAIVVAFLTVSFQSIKAALANPVKSLRSE